jgi:hypothetical protein
MLFARTALASGPHADFSAGKGIILERGGKSPLSGGAMRRAGLSLDRRKGSEKAPSCRRTSKNQAFTLKDLIPIASSWIFNAV